MKQKHAAADAACFLLLRDEMIVWDIFVCANYAFFQLLSAYAFGMLELMRSRTAVH